jgi:uncharacterized protein
LNHRNLFGIQTKLCVSLGDFDKFQHKALAHLILDTAREQKLAGGTMLRGSEGFGRSKRLHLGMELEGAGERPILLEFVDESERICQFCKLIEPMLSGELVTERKVFVHYYECEKKKGEDTMKDKGLPIESSRIARAAVHLSGQNVLLRIYISELDKIGHRALHLELLERAKKFGLAGATVIHGIAGFGATSTVHAEHRFRLSHDLPVVIEIVDTQEYTNRFMEEISPLLQGALVTEEVVVVHPASKSREHKVDEHRSDSQY